MLSQKENYLRVLRHQIPEWIPKYTFGKMGPSDVEPPNAIVTPYMLVDHRIRGGGKDHWGVEYISSKESAGAIIPKTWDFLLKDITKWRDVIKAPSLEGIDWEQLAKKSIEATGINRDETCCAFNLHFGYFQNLMAFMGFEEGLMMFYEEPEEVHALLNYLSDFYCEVAGKIIDYIKPDVFTMMDDTASWQSLFISPDMYREFLLPCYKREAQFALDRGLPITFHNCGHCEAIVDDMVQMGVCSWDPAQTCNDLKGIKERYAGKLAIAGGWDSMGRVLDADCPDEFLRQSVIDCVNMLAPNGDFMWCGGIFSADPNDPIIAHKNAVIDETFEELSRTFYR